MCDAGGWKHPEGNTNVIQYITFASTGNAQDFGDVDYTNGMRASGAFSSPLVVCLLVVLISK